MPTVSPNDLNGLIESLTEEQRKSVSEFIVFLKNGERPASSPFLSAADEFIEQHPELLRRLAQ